MKEPSSDSLGAWFARWVDFVRRFAGAVLVLSLLSAAGGGYYAATHLSVTTDTADMFSPDLPFRRNMEALDKAFPQGGGTVLVVIDAATPGLADDAAARLTKRLREKPRLFKSVFDAAGEPFFQRNGLLYLDRDELGRLIDRLASAQAFLGALHRDPSMRGLFHVLGLALDNQGNLTADLSFVFDSIAKVANEQRAGKFGILAWRDIMEGKPSKPGDRRHFVVVRPDVNFNSLQPAADALREIRRAVAALNLTPDHGVRVRLTGSVPLEEDEFGSVAKGMGIAGFLSFTLVFLLLLWGLRSMRLLVSAVVTLIIGLVWTAWFAAFAVGQLNLISVAFAVLFIGLSVDFGIHFALCYREGVNAGASQANALSATGQSVGRALALSAVAAAIGFFSFLPTDYLGLAQLGLIAGAGMFIALFANLTVLPALLALLPVQPTATTPSTIMLDSVRGALDRRPRTVLLGTVALAIVAAGFATGARFDFDPLNIKERSKESVSTLLELMKDKNFGFYSIEILAPNLAAAEAEAKRLDALPQVKETRTLASYIPKDQDDKLQMIDSAALFLLPSLSAEKRTAPPTPAERRAAVQTLRKKLEAYARSASASPAGRASAHRLDDALAKLAAMPSSDTVLAEFGRRLVATLPGRLNALREAMSAEPVTLQTLPAPIRARELAPDGQAHIDVTPAKNVRIPANMRDFVAAVRTIAPNASGSPVVIYESGRAVLRAFIEAGAISVVLIAGLTIVLLRNLRDVMMILAPLFLAGLLTTAIAAGFGLAFNYANVIVVPLLFGLGVASSIHLVLRERHEADFDRMMDSSTPRAVVFSALTTIGSFGSIALSSHPGTASMGVLLTIAILTSLFSALVFLPALMAVFGRRAEVS